MVPAEAASSAAHMAAKSTPWRAQASSSVAIAAGAAIDTAFITRQRGMFSYSGLGKAQMQRLRSEFGVYGVDSGRICVAALNERNLDQVVAAISQVTEKASA